MLTFISLNENLSSLGPTAVAIGNFDGLHLGHQKIIESLVREAEKLKLKSVVLTFSPHPEKILGQETIRMIQTINQRLQGLEQLGVEATLIIPFHDDFFRLGPEEFIQKILIDRLQARLIIVGADFRFGYGRQGNPEYLARAGEKAGFRVITIPPVMLDGEVVSSSLIRQLLEKGEVDLAARFLGHPYEIEGLVIKGDSRGQILGLPTANIEPKNEILPPGVFISESQVKDRVFPSVTNIGFRPTFGSASQTVESHLLNFSGTLYGQEIKTRLLKKIREEKKFPDAESLRQQILKDIEQARLYWAKA